MPITPAQQAELEEMVDDLIEEFCEQEQVSSREQVAIAIAEQLREEYGTCA